MIALKNPLTGAIWRDLNTLRDAQEGAESVEIVSLNIIDGTPLLIARNVFGVYVNYGLFTTGDKEWSPESRLQDIGNLTFRVWEHADREASVSDAYLTKSYRGKGVGKYIYKTAINDLFDRGMKLVTSDTLANQSPDATHIWMSLHRSNPDRVNLRVVPGFEDDPERYRFTRWSVTGYIRRRPVYVRRHVRRCR